MLTLMKKLIFSILFVTSFLFGNAQIFYPEVGQTLKTGDNMLLMSFDVTEIAGNDTSLYYTLPNTVEEFSMCTYWENVEGDGKAEFYVQADPWGNRFVLYSDSTSTFKIPGSISDSLYCLYGDIIPFSGVQLKLYRVSGTDTIIAGNISCNIHLKINK